MKNIFKKKTTPKQESCLPKPGDIRIQSSVFPAKQPDYNQWVASVGFGSAYPRTKTKIIY